MKMQLLKKGTKKMQEEKKMLENKRKNEDSVPDQSFQFNENCAGVSVLNSTPKKISEKESWKGKVFVVSEK